MKIGLIAALCLAGTLHASATTVRLAVLIANNRGGEGQIRLRYSELDARRLAGVLQDYGRFKKENTLLLLGRSAEAVKRRLAALTLRIRGLRQNKRHVMLLLYYSGHADGVALRLGASRLSFAWLKRYLEESRAEIRIGLIDACHSGAVIRSKGARHGIDFPIRLDDRLSTRGLAIIASSSKDEVSQESSRIGGSFFTHFVISGLRGAAERDNDGRVSLSELYHYVYHRTVLHTARSMAGIQHPTYYLRLRGRGEVVLTHLRGQRRMVFAARLSGTFLVVRRDGLVVAEVRKNAGRELALTLKPGTYDVRHRRSRRFASATIVVPTQKDVAVSASDFHPLLLSQYTLKGGSRAVVHSPEALFVVTNGLLANQDGLYGVQLGYSLGFGKLVIAPALRVITKMVRDESLRYRFIQLDLLLDIGAAVVAQRLVDVFLGSQLALVYFQQHFSALNQRRHSLGARLAAAFGLRIHLGADVDLLLRLSLGVSLIKRNGMVSLPFHTGGAIGLGVRF